MLRFTPDRCLLRQILKNKKLSQKWLCEVTGYPESQISDYVNNRTTMGFATAVTIAKHLSIHPEDLYTWKVTN